MTAELARVIYRDLRADGLPSGRPQVSPVRRHRRRAGRRHRPAVVGADLSTEPLAAEDTETADTAAAGPTVATDSTEPSPAQPTVAAEEFRSAADPASTGSWSRPAPSARPRQHRAVHTLHDAGRQRPCRAAHHHRLVGMGPFHRSSRPRAEGLHRRTSSTRRPAHPRAVSSRTGLHPQRPLPTPPSCRRSGDTLGAAGFSGGPLSSNPAAAAFIGHAPEGATLVGVEVDDITAAIAALLCPQLRSATKVWRPPAYRR